MEAFARRPPSLTRGLRDILVAKNFDLGQWGQAIDDGALEVLDAVRELPRAIEVAKCALWTEYLTGAWPDLEVPDSSAVS
jgi:hypothetical protein